VNADRATLAAASLGLAILLASCGSDPDAASAADSSLPDPATISLPPAQREQISVTAVAQSEFHPEVSTTGTVAYDGYRSTQVLAPISGPVMRILVQPGDHVAQGQALAYVSSPDFASAVADFRKAQAADANAQRIANLDSALFENDAIARRELEQARTEALSARADREAALQQLAALGVEKSTLDSLQAGQSVTAAHGVIRAPISGTLVERLITPGQLLEAGATPCFNIADISKMWVMANVFASDLAKVSVGDRATITTSASASSLTGTVDNISAFVDPSTKATAVRIVVPNTTHLLKKDMYVSVSLRSRRSESGLLIPVAAVLRDEDNQPFVYIERPSGGYSRRTITLGARIDDRYEIAAGLTEGEKVVSGGGLFLQFGQSQ
jgi:cobalt-zinc-cadmium efflux system membrane fusion protein